MDGNTNQTQFIYQIPEKKINDATEFNKWLTSKARAVYVQFIMDLNDAIKGKKLSELTKLENSKFIDNIMHLLDKLDKWVDEIPPTQQPTRYGNKAFRTWQGKLEADAENLMKEILPSNYKEAAKELGPYLANAFGNPTRIDYGTGHEACFVMWLLCMNIVGIIQKTDFPSLVTKVFNRYLYLMRKIQTTYWLEPAGSRGVWGLDDFQFLPYLWGASQLIGTPYFVANYSIGHETIKPKSIHDKAIVEANAEEYYYMGCVRFIYQVKKGPFGEHSPKLNDISFVPHQLWEKVNAGMIKMYNLEVLEKFPVIQHVLFGAIFPFE